MKGRILLLLPFLFILSAFSGIYPVKSKPIKELQEFTVVLEQKGWISDATRIKKKHIYGELNRGGMKLFNSKPFYPISYEDTMLRKFESRFPSEDFSLFKNVKNIWGYYYKDEKAKEMITDGVIEQWEFASHKDAQQAMTYMHKHGHDIYFNTMPYFCCINNHVIVFQARAMAFSYSQKPVYELFVEKYHPVIP